MLSEDELHTVECVRAGEEADFSHRSARTLRASFIKALMLGLPLGEYADGVPLTGLGVRIRGARLDGHLNLEYGALTEGSYMPGLALSDCEIPDGMNLKSARLQRLCLKGSRIHWLEADHVHINGLLDVREVHAPAPNRECRLTLRGAHIMDGIEAGGARLCAPEANNGYEKYAERSIYALDLPEAQVNGDIRLFPNFSATGGINLNGATINGSVHAHGAKLKSGQLYAFDGCGAHIKGNLALDSRNISATEHAAARLQGISLDGTSRFQCDGQLRLHNLILDEDLRLYGARICGELGRIAAENATIRGDACLCAFDNARGKRRSEADDYTGFTPEILPFECEGRIDMRGTFVGGDLNLKGAHLGSEIDVSTGVVEGHVLCAPQVHREKAREELRDKTLVERFVCDGHMKFNGLKVLGNLIMEGAQLNDKLTAYGIRVEGYARLSPFVQSHENGTVWRFEAAKRIILENGYVGQKLDMSGAWLRDELRAANIQVGSSLLMCAHTCVERSDVFFWFEAALRVNLSAADIKGNLDLCGARLGKGLRLRGGHIHSALLIDIFDHHENSPDASGKRVFRKKSIDLFNAHAAILSDHRFLRGITNTNHQHEELRLGYSPSYFIRLEGFTYDRFRHYADEESLEIREKARRERIKAAIAKRLGAKFDRESFLQTPMPQELLNIRLNDWLKLQYRGERSDGKREADRKNYNPDPYNTLYKYYKKMGAQDIADQVLFKKLKIERRISSTVSKVIYKPFEFFYGFGLRPIRATLYYAGFIALLSLGTYISDQGPGIAVYKPWPTAPFEVAFGGRQYVDVNSRGGPCGKERTLAQAINYAMETAVPGLDLGERKVCDFTSASGGLLLITRILAIIAGWVMAWLTILTWSGLFRKNIEP